MPFWSVERACDPSRYEPDLALNLEICDVIKEKQKNTYVSSPAAPEKRSLDTLASRAHTRLKLSRTTHDLSNLSPRTFSPREAAIYIVRLVNNKNMHVGMLALTVGASSTGPTCRPLRMA